MTGDDQPLTGRLAAEQPSDLPAGDPGDDIRQQLELALEELEVLGRHLADATVTIERLRTRLVELEAQEARSLKGRLRRFVDRALGVPARPLLSAELPPSPLPGRSSGDTPPLG